MDIRGALAADEVAWRGLWDGFLGFYGVTLDAAVTAHTWARIVDPEHRMTCRMAFDGTTALGFAIHHHHCSTWVMGDDVYLEDLFVVPEARGAGIGKALLVHLAGIAVARGYARFEWSVLDWNAPAIGFYQGLGAVMQDEWTKMRVDGAALVRLAAG